MKIFSRKIARSPQLESQIEEHGRELIEEGVTRIQNALPAEIVSETLASVKGFLQRNAPVFQPHVDADGHYPRIINLHIAERSLLRLFAECPIALAVQDRFFRSESVLYTSLYYERGSAQPVHRDSPYFCTKPEYRYLGVWVALEDANEGNGCLEVVRKGHLLPEIDKTTIALRHFRNLDEVPNSSQALWDDYQAEVVAACNERGLETERLTANAGDVIIWHPQLPHGGSEIGDLSRTRHSFVMHVTPENTPVYQHDVFFNPTKAVPDRARWAYSRFGERKFAPHKTVDIAGTDRRPLSDFAL